MDRQPPAARAIAMAEVPAAVDAIAPHEVRLIAGLDASALADLLALAPPRRPVLRLDLAGPGDAATVVERAIVLLARAVAGLWPYLWGGEDFSDLRDDALARAHLPLRLAALAERQPALARAWAHEIVPRLQRGASPRLAVPSPHVEWRQLALAFAPAGLVVAVPLVHADDGFVAAVEWLARHADVAVLVLAETLPTGRASERILFGALTLERAAPGSRAAEPHPSREPPTAKLPPVIALPATEGMPHPQSEVELRLYTLIQADPDLRPLFAFNLFVPDVALLQAKADLLWPAGRLVVEIDGPEHRGAAKYRADRLRDYRLMLAGWRVLRLTNEDIITDAALALERVRDVVRLVQGEAR